MNKQKVIITNKFSINMIPSANVTLIRFKRISEEELLSYELVSAVDNEIFAKILTKLLKVEITVRKYPIKLESYPKIIIAKPVLAKNKHEKARMEYYVVEVVH